MAAPRAAARAGGAPPPAPPPPAARVLVYSGPGAGARSVLSALHALRRALAPRVAIAPLSAAALLDGGWRASATALVMPGGADLPYCAALDGAGVALIREFLEEQGGSYLGLCAGAYFASARVEFELGNPALAVDGARELALFPGAARGAVALGFDYGSEAGAAAAALRFRPAGGGGAPDGEGLTRSCADYVNGGCAFHAFPAARAPRDFEVLSRYAGLAGGAPAAVLCRVGAGRAVLCGTHPELDTSFLGAPDGATDAAGPRGGGCAPGDARCAGVRAVLEAGAAARGEYWRALLAHAGLEHLLARPPP
jgi:biotin--protein ligase